ncbi:FemAB family XrtA/PEP-CTERM system-associated protein [Sphingosinicella terrae]|uniref:FemAB family XrtA/PEP-CTERM system-associated protein n=1 Tax=Sphingosinicella terrae TaxID=2172047 RepID=UPI000E0D297F|nr:FemAB family XrtA/PEP-CTERM system-associated protein [Sphingosinicella terrae]
MNAPAPALAVAVRAIDTKDAAQAARLDAFVAEHPEGTIFHRPGWGRGVEQGCGQRGQYLVAERGGALVGCLPLTEMRSPLFGNALVSTGFGTGGGILAESDTAARALAEAGWRAAESAGCGTIELRGGPVPEGFARREGFASRFERSLAADEETLLKLIPRRQRAEVRRALAVAPLTTVGTDRAHVEAHFRVYGESVRNLGTPVFPRRLFEAMLDAFPGEAEIVAVWHDGHAVATHFNFYFKDVCLPFWGGGTREARTCRANDLIWFEVMLRALGRGCRTVDFGRSKVGTGPWQRKKIWGFEEVPLVYAVRAGAGGAPRELDPKDPKYRLKIALWKKLPLWAANRIGPLIARGLG